jgi:hypothetical protein
MRKERMFGLLVLAIVAVSILSLPQAYAKASGPKTKKGAMYLISSVSNPSGGCGNFGLTGSYGNVMVGNGAVTILLQDAHPSSKYIVSVDQFSQGACDGSWQSVGSVSTNQVGSGQLVQQLNLQPGQIYVFEFKDAQGGLVYATS